MTTEVNKGTAPTELAEYLGSRYLNRELSWLAFNERVLEEAENRQNPLLERVKFLAISASNLDEFYMVRVAGLHNQVRMNIQKHSVDGLKPEEQLQKIQVYTDGLIAHQHECWTGLKKELQKQKIEIIRATDYLEEHSTWLQQHFEEDIFPALTPITLDANHTFPFLPNLSLSMIFKLVSGKKDVIHAIIPFPPGLNRFIALPSVKGSKIKRFAILEDVIDAFKGQLFPKYDVQGSGLIHLMRDSDIDITEEAEDLVQSFENALKKRQHADVIRLTVNNDIPEDILQFLIKHLGVTDKTITGRDELPGMGAIRELYELERADLKFKPHHSRFPERIDDFGGDCFAAIYNKDIIVHHPYESFLVVVRFLEQAASDPNVVAIKQTLYRTSKESPIVKALIKAAKAGKSVTAVVELKARFDEEANLRWGRDLENAGVQVVYGMPNYKVHSKVSLVVRKVEGDLQSYVHFGTGNYHAVTAKVYSDLSFFTCDPALCRDAALLFNYMTGSTVPEQFEKIAVSPINMRNTLMGLIENEITHAKEGEPANIWIKVNSLLDPELIDALYKASQAGVSIDIIARGICTIRPGIKGLSENIRVKSIVGRFLEHARIFCFGAGHQLPSPSAKVFMASADWMPRNMDQRVEVMVPIENPTVHEQVLGQIMLANIRDERQSWLMESDGGYTRVKAPEDGFSAHQFFLHNPSLSGRGSALYGRKTQATFPLIASVSGKFSKVAVLDIGSNSVRLVVYDGLKRVPLPIFNEKVLCGLARNMEQDKKLNPDGVALAQTAIKRYMTILQAMGVNTIFAFATAAVRDAKDGKNFVRKLERSYHIEVQVLSGEEESWRAALGVVASFHEADGVVCDLGGGSLELANICFNADQEYEADEIIQDNKSFPIGTLRLYNLADGDLTKAQDIVTDHLADYPLKKYAQGKTLYAVGGGFRALAKVHLASSEHPLQVLEHYQIKTDEFITTLNLVLESDLDTIARLPSMSQKRLDTIQFTAVLVKSLLELSQAEYVMFSTSGVREGVLYHELSPQHQSLDALIAVAADSIAHISPDSGKQWIAFGYELFHWMHTLFPEEARSIRRLRHAACVLGRLAWHEHVAYRGEMAFRWVLDTELPSLDHDERVFIAMAVFYRYQSQDTHNVTKKIKKLLKKKKRRAAKIIGRTMQLGYEVSGGAPGILPRVKLEYKNGKLAIKTSKEDRSLLSKEVMRRLAVLESLLN